MAFMSYNPSIGRVLAAGDVKDFQTLNVYVGVGSSNLPSPNILLY